MDNVLSLLVSDMVVHGRSFPLWSLGTGRSFLSFLRFLCDD